MEKKSLLENLDEEPFRYLFIPHPDSNENCGLIYLILPTKK